METKTRWYKDGDRNTKFFHPAASTRRNVNHIVSLEDDYDNKITDDGGMRSITKSYFINLFQKQHNISALVIDVIRTLVSSEDNISLTKPNVLKGEQRSLGSQSGK